MILKPFLAVALMSVTVLHLIGDYMNKDCLSQPSGGGIHIEVRKNISFIASEHCVLEQLRIPLHV